ncbi:MAG: DUF4190 domain-containing protein, partial [Acidobacteriota bacterium]|nr:DUF4190 domain-containing protein [Acidobacteriota bacterium]
MKKCPTCNKTFDDNLRFCQTDGTPLVTVAETASEDPYKTMVASQDEMASAIPPDPFKTIVSGMPIKDEDEVVLDLSDKPDPLKTPVISQEEIKTQIKTSQTDSAKDAPSSPFDIPPPTYPPLVKSSDDLSSAPPAPPKFNEPSLNPPNFGDASSEESSGDKDSAPPYIPASQSPFDNPSSPPIPSPFDGSMVGYQAPSKPKPPFDEPKKPSDAAQDSFNQSPFGEQQSPFDQQPLQQANWSPPPAPDASWQNQEIGQNTPFQPPSAAGSGQNQTLAIVSLVLGILSIPCCGFILFGIAALVTGFMAKSKAEKNPNEYGGRGLALGG